MQTTRKHPRTLEEAFGPYTGHEFEDDKPTGYGALWWSAVVIISVIGGYLIVTGVPT